ncbi:DUF1778 domain-containing protein [Xenorhabdus hominickii]|uniref:CopG family transcriptional regulator n=1 Tax=Xenorhabdus hominickii TaxID=351679 RepID=A0A1V0M479_XENHO|nr:DUF1778 domain-containing protein [Xenorhabdus hominickii]ARD69669.1 hypothetical protein [Xenorhabdus hominickii]PHM52383.1 CopG family transcriptional regulator [Xenorhabdus hominickii]
MNMTEIQTSNRKAKNLNLRINESDRELISKAAEAKGKTLSEYVLDTMRSDAQNTLLEQSFLVVSPDAYDLFMKALDAPAAVNTNLAKTTNMLKPF